MHWVWMGCDFSGFQKAPILIFFIKIDFVKSFFIMIAITKNNVKYKFRKMLKD